MAIARLPGLRQICGILTLFGALGALLLISPVSKAAAEVAGPGWYNAQAEPPSPGQVKSTFAPQSLGLEPLNLSAEPSSEVVELARGLQHDPRLIYEYVRNHIDYVPYFGSLKGATLTHLELCGNDFDQASLMIELLRESGYSAQYVYGTMTIPNYSLPDNYNLLNWLGVDDPATAYKLLGNGGIPAQVYSTYSVVDRIWVKANIDGNDYLFDPAFKKYEDTPGVDLAAAMGYDKSALLAAAGGEVGADYVRNLNEAGFQLKLEELAGNLINFIRTNYPNADVDEIIGGRGIIPEYLTELQTNLRFATNALEYWDTIPDAYVHKIRIQHGEIDEILAIPDIAGKKLAITYDTTGASATALAASEETTEETAPDLFPVQPPARSGEYLTGDTTKQITGDEVESQDAVLDKQIEGVVAEANPTVNFGKLYPPSITSHSSTWSRTVQNPNQVDILVRISIINNPSGAFAFVDPDNDYHWLLPGQQWTYSVRFSNANQSSGPKAAQLEERWIYQGSTFQTIIVDLQGAVAQPYNLAGSNGVSFKTFLGYPQDGSCSLKNSGSLPLIINSMSRTGNNPEQFRFLSGNGAGTLSAGSIRTINLQYLASALGSHSTYIYIDFTYDDMHYPINVFLINGWTGRVPDLGLYQFNAGQRYLGDPLDGKCQLKNNGVLSLTITSVTLTGTDSGRFELLSGTGSGSLAPGASRDFDVKYLADVLGSHNADIRIEFTYDSVSTYVLIPLTGETVAPPPARLWLDDELIAEETGPVSGTKLADLRLEVDHPYSGGNEEAFDQWSVYNLKRGSTYVIMSGFGGSSQGRLLKKRQRMLDDYRASGLADDSRQVLTETLNVMGQTWLQETTMNKNLIDQLLDVITIRHHRFGLAAQEKGYYVDVATQMNAVVSKYSNISAEDSAFKSGSHLASAMEHGVLEQLQVNRPAASTVKLLHLANGNGTKVFYVTQANYASIRPQLSNYSDNDLDDFQNKVNDGAIFILPADGKIILEQWAGKGYMEYGENDGMRHMGMIIGGDYYGGYGAITGDLNINDVTDDYYFENFEKAEVVKVQSKEPVNLGTGAYLFDHEDLALGGSEPLGLHFRRSYNSNNSHEKTSLGYGWSHNYNIYARVHSDAQAGLGMRQPVDAAALIVAAFATSDLMLQNPDIKDWMASALVANWAMDQLTDNAVSMTVRSDALTFLKLPDGSYSSPPGVTTKLVRDAGRYRLEERFDTGIQFNAEDRISSWQDADGNTMAFTYSGDKLQTVTDAFGRILSFSYIGDLLDSVSDSAGRSVSFDYDAAENLVGYTDPESKLWRYGYDGQHRMTSLTNPLDITTAVNTYDSLGQVDTQTVPRQGGGTVTYNFHFSGFRNVENDPEGNPTIHYFDEKGRAIGEENALGHKSSRKYDGQNHVTEETDPRQHTTYFYYDGDHNLVSTVNALGDPTDYDYDEHHRKTDVIDALSHHTHFDYDSEHHLIRTTIYPEAGKEIYAESTYYDIGLPKTAKDGRDIVTNMAYDSFGNPASTQTAAEPAVTYLYDPIGRMEELTDQANATTRMVYDDGGLLLTRTDPLNRMAQFAYYDDGRLYSQADRNNDTIRYTYTPSGKVDTVMYPDLMEVRFVYDGRDNLRQMQDPLGTSYYDYDKADRLISTTDPNGFEISYVYDEAGNLVELVYPGDKRVIYTYDALNRLKTVTIGWLNKTAFYYYDDAGRLTDFINFNGTWTSYDYDDADRLIGMDCTTSDMAIVTEYNFTLDGNGNRIQVDRIEPLRTYLSAGLTDYTYNPQRNRLVSAAGFSYDYDFEGQLSGINDTTYEFDSDHRLVVVSGDESYNYVYDGNDNRLEAMRNGILTKYIYDASGSLLAEADAGNVITRYYIYGQGLLAMVTPTDELYCYHYDAIGNTIAVTDADQQVVNAYAYTPFGIITNKQEAISQSFTFVGQHGVMTEPNGFYYMRARYYDPQTGRFISEDPMGFDGGDVNLYIYAQNNPIIFLDPNGQAVLYWGAGGGVGLGIDTRASDKINYLSASGYRYAGSTRSGGGEDGILFSGGAGRIVGGSFGGGPVFGVHFGDVEDISGRATETGIIVGPLSITLTFNDNNSWTGFSFGFGSKGWGVGAYSQETRSARFAIEKNY